MEGFIISFILNLKMKYIEFEPHLDDILISLKTNLTQALLNKV